MIRNLVLNVLKNMGNYWNIGNFRLLIDHVKLFIFWLFQLKFYKKMVKSKKFFLIFCLINDGFPEWDWWEINVFDEMNNQGFVLFSKINLFNLHIFWNFLKSSINLKKEWEVEVETWQTLYYWNSPARYLQLEFSLKLLAWKLMPDSLRQGRAVHLKDF